MAIFPGTLTELIAEARRNPARLPVALISSSVVLSAVALALIIFRAPGGIFVHLHGSAPPGYLYYGILCAVVIFGAETSFGYWVVPRDLDGWHAAGKTVLWISLFPLVLVFALGGLAFLK